MFYQTLPLLLLSQNESFKELKNPSAAHYIVGMEHLLTESTKLTVEVYQKDYSNFPMDPKQPAIFVLDKNYCDNYESLLDNGKASSKGVEIMVQKKLAENFYGKQKVYISLRLSRLCGESYFFALKSVKKMTIM